ncbi:MAG TPA: rod shape-determining protein MreD [Thermodesulfovibrionales bacterium]|nr:rod shape-determining protein MreD [Thermodesulfovibrionales bacterium]
MTYILWVVIILFTFFMKEKVSFFDVAPNFTAVLVYYAGMRKGELQGMFLGSLIGFIEDSLSGAFLGPNLLSKSIVGYFSSFMSGSFFRWTPLLGLIGISVLTLIDNALVFASRSFFDRMPTSMKAAVFITIIQSLINAPLGLLLKPKDMQKTA